MKTNIDVIKAQPNLSTYLETRERNRGDTALVEVMRRLKEAGTLPDKATIVKEFKALEEAGLGRLVFGRRGGASRFIWNHSLIDLKNTIQGKPLKEVQESAPEIQEARTHFSEVGSSTIKIVSGDLTIEVNKNASEETLARVLRLVKESSSL